MTFKKTFPILTICLLIFAGCGTEKNSPNEQVAKKAVEKTSTQTTSDWDAFWSSFTSAVQNDDGKSVAEMTVMPLKGHHHGALDAAHFSSHFQDIFDGRAKETFAKADDRSFITLKVETPEQATMMNVPQGTEVKTISVQYIFDAGSEAQTESTTVFIFGKNDGEFKLLSILQAG